MRRRRGPKSGKIVVGVADLVVQFEGGEASGRSGSASKASRLRDCDDSRVRWIYENIEAFLGHRRGCGRQDTEA